jgi:hypothetical protein
VTHNVPIPVTATVEQPTRSVVRLPSPPSQRFRGIMLPSGPSTRSAHDVRKHHGGPYHNQLAGMNVTQEEADAILQQLAEGDTNKVKTWSRIVVEKYLLKVRNVRMHASKHARIRYCVASGFDEMRCDAINQLIDYVLAALRFVLSSSLFLTPSTSFSLHYSHLSSQ